MGKGEEGEEEEEKIHCRPTQEGHLFIVLRDMSL